jgi:hypothetical protein
MERNGDGILAGLLGEGCSHRSHCGAFEEDGSGVSGEASQDGDTEGGGSMVALKNIDIMLDGADAMGVTDDELLRAYNYFTHLQGRYNEIARLMLAESIGRRMLEADDDE